MRRCVTLGCSLPRTYGKERGNRDSTGRDASEPCLVLKNKVNKDTTSNNVMKGARSSYSSAPRLIRRYIRKCSCVGDGMR